MKDDNFLTKLYEIDAAMGRTWEAHLLHLWRQFEPKDDTAEHERMEEAAMEREFYLALEGGTPCKTS